MASKPFTPEEARRIVQFLLTPAVLLNMTTDWPALHWTVEQLSACLTERLRFRIGKRTEDMAPLFETECSYIEATIKEFLSWTAKEDESLGGPFADYHCKEFWAYADYRMCCGLNLAFRAEMDETAHFGLGHKVLTLHVILTLMVAILFSRSKAGIDGISFLPMTHTASTQHVYHTRSPVCSAGLVWSIPT